MLSVQEDVLTKVIPAQQLARISHHKNCKDVFAGLRKMIAAIPKLYSQEHIKDPIVHALYYYRDSHWFITEYDQGKDLYFGYVILNGWTDCAELGYIYAPELVELSHPIKFDTGFQPKDLSLCLADLGLKRRCA